MNRFSLAILCVCILACASAQNACKIFSCGSITQPAEGPKSCVQTTAQNEVETFHVANCADETVCQAFKWTAPSDASAGDGACGTDKPETPTWGQFVPADNTALDGDRCEQVSHCKKTDLNTPTCENNVCKSSIGAGETCAESTECPVDHVCSGEPLVCTALLAEGAECAATADCKFGLTCFFADDQAETKATCQRGGNIANGKMFKRVTAEATEVNADLVGAPECQSRFAVASGDAFQCRQATSNKDSSLTRPTAGENCPLLVFDNDDMEKWNESREDTESSVAMCGFNMDSNAYCVPQPGDSAVMELFQLEAKQTLRCRRESTGQGTGSFCNDLYVWQNSKDGWRFHLGTSNVGTVAAQNHANVANNDQCVAETVNVNFWQGHFGDNAFGLSVAAVSVAALSFVF